MVTDSWDDLQRRARYLENDIDSKLIQYATLKHDTVSQWDPVTSVKSDERSRNSAYFQMDRQNMLASEVENLLLQLTQVNDRMTELVRDVDGDVATIITTTSQTNTHFGHTNSSSTSPTSGQISQLHTAKRHREILRDYVQEFRRTKIRLAANAEREQLLKSMNRGGSSGSGDPHDLNKSQSSSSPSSSETRILLAEQERYFRSNRMVDNHLAAASNIRSALRSQRNNLRQATSGLHNLSNQFPRIKQLVGKIDWRHRKDSIVLGIVIAVCVAFLLIYKLS